MDTEGERRCLLIEWGVGREWGVLVVGWVRVHTGTYLGIYHVPM